MDNDLDDLRLKVRSIFIEIVKVVLNENIENVLNDEESDLEEKIDVI